jgi:hypothetical protein
LSKYVENQLKITEKDYNISKTLNKWFKKDRLNNGLKWFPKALKIILRN